MVDAGGVDGCYGRVLCGAGDEGPGCGGLVEERRGGLRLLLGRLWGDWLLRWRELREWGGDVLVLGMEVCRRWVGRGV